MWMRNVSFWKVRLPPVPVCLQYGTDMLPALGQMLDHTVCVHNCHFAKCHLCVCYIYIHTLSNLLWIGLPSEGKCSIVCTVMNYPPHAYSVLRMCHRSPQHHTCDLWDQLHYIVCSIFCLLSTVEDYCSSLTLYHVFYIATVLQLKTTAALAWLLYTVQLKTVCP